jgi:inositol-hexakisphosphate/diphosphoinositol-pentakisphosphate 1-kinase
MILHQPVEEWPVVQVLVAFYSKGYPLSKAKEYVELRRPFVLNDLDMQITLQDRRKVYDLLEASGIDVPRHIFFSADGYVSTGTGDGNRKEGQSVAEVEEFDDHIEVNGVSIQKPFVEKPVDADDHNIAIYYPSSAGGGCKKLFRKIGNRSRYVCVSSAREEK